MKKSFKKDSRRKFIRQNLLTGAAAILGAKATSALSPSLQSKEKLANVGC